MRLPGIGATLDLSETVHAPKRLDELAPANVNSLIFERAGPTTVLSLAGQSGLYRMVEIGSMPVFASRSNTCAIDRIAKAVKDLRGYPSLIGFLIDCPLDHMRLRTSRHISCTTPSTAIVRAIARPTAVF